MWDVGAGGMKARAVVAFFQHREGQVPNNVLTMAPTPPSSRGPREVALALMASVRGEEGGAGPRAGFGVRVGLSLVGAAAGVGVLMLVLGLIETYVARVRDEHVAIGIVFVLLGWVLWLYRVWGSYSKKRHILRTILICLGIAVATIGVGSAFGAAMHHPEFLIAGTVFLGVAGVAGVITGAAFEGSRGRAIRSRGAVNVVCPGCGYSMSGLETSVCPECGARYTLDQLIAGQGYEGVGVGVGVGPALSAAPALPEPATPARGALPSSVE
jgi:hypothetical protein